MGKGPTDADRRGRAEEDVVGAADLAADLLGAADFRAAADLRGAADFVPAADFRAAGGLAGVADFGGLDFVRPADVAARDFAGVAARR